MFRSIKESIKEAIILAVPLTVRRFLIRSTVLKIFPYPALDLIDRKIERICREICNRNAFFIEVGANDGIQQSNTYFLEKKYHARGLLIEPSPMRFVDLIKNRSKNNFYRCCALVPFDYGEKFVEMVYSDLISIALINKDTDLGIDVDEFIGRGEKYLRKGETSFKFLSPAVNLSTILDEIKAPKMIDFFSLDVEGNELNVLKGIDFDTYQFRFILIERRNLERIDNFLAPLGYELVDKFTHQERILHCVDVLYRLKDI